MVLSNTLYIGISCEVTGLSEISILLFDIDTNVSTAGHPLSPERTISDRDQIFKPFLNPSDPARAPKVYDKNTQKKDDADPEVSFVHVYYSVTVISPPCYFPSLLFLPFANSTCSYCEWGRIMGKQSVEYLDTDIEWMADV
jgi:hypothetical protein